MDIINLLELQEIKRNTDATQLETLQQGFDHHCINKMIDVIEMHTGKIIGIYKENLLQNKILRAWIDNGKVKYSSLEKTGHKKVLELININNDILVKYWSYIIDTKDYQSAYKAMSYEDMHKDILKQLNKAI